MKKFYNILLPAIMAVAFAACNTEPEGTDFGISSKEFEVAAEGGELKLHVASNESWVATTSKPWIVVSPANGNKSTECKLIIDSALMTTPRDGEIRIKNQKTNQEEIIKVTQKGFDYTIGLEQESVEVANFAKATERYFEVTVTANTNFDVEIASGEWLTVVSKKPYIDLDRGARPRKSVLRFEWKINSMDLDRHAEIIIKPASGSDAPVGIARTLNATQLASLDFVGKENTREADSLALLAVARSLGMSTGKWDTSERIDTWYNVEVWDERDEGFDAAKHRDANGKMRVRYAYFFSFNTNDVIPYEIQYLNALDHLNIGTNGNKFLKSLSTGEYLCKLTQLRYLTLYSYGLTELHPDFVNLSNLVYLDLGGNNFQTVPDVLNQSNFPKLQYLSFVVNKRREVLDLSNTVYTDYGGLADEATFPIRLLEWDNLVYLRLSNNFLTGELPDMEHMPKYTEAEIIAADSLVDAADMPYINTIVGMPKVLPKAVYLALNLNQFTGEIPKWLLYHPALDLMGSHSLIYPQQGINAAGVVAGFSNVPPSMVNYGKDKNGVDRPSYYDVYTHPTKQKRNPANK